MLLSAVFGMNALKKLDSVSIPLLIIIMLVGKVIAFRNFSADGLYVEVEQSIPNYENGMELTVFVLSAPGIWKTERGLEVSGPRSFGFDCDYVSFNEK